MWFESREPTTIAQLAVPMAPSCSSSTSTTGQRSERTSWPSCVTGGRSSTKPGVAVYGISRDSPWSHAAWAEVLGLDFSAVRLERRGAVDAFDVAFENDGLRDTAERSAFLVGADGIIRRTWRFEVFELPNLDELLAAARSL